MVRNVAVWGALLMVVIRARERWRVHALRPKETKTEGNVGFGWSSNVDGMHGRVTRYTLR